MAEIEQMEEIPAEPRDPPRKSRFELLSIRPLVTSDPKFGEGNMFGLISVSDKYGSRSDVGSHLFEPDYPYVSLFNFEWCDPIKMRNGGTVHLGNRTSHLSVPFSTAIEIRFELYVTCEKKDACFQLANRKFKKKLSGIWEDKSNSKCGSYNVKGVDGRTRMHYILIKDAVDTSMEVRFNAGTDHRVHGDIFAYYGSNSFSYECPSGIKSDYGAKLFSSDITDGLISLERSFLAVPTDASLIIKGCLVDLDTNEVILSGCYEFTPPTKGCSTAGTLYGLDGTNCSLELKVDWKY